MALLTLDNVHTYYGNIHALKGISITVDEGEIVTLIGANGAGKSTTLKTISGLLYPRKGKVYLGDKDLTKISAHEIVKMGVIHVPEGRRVFSRLTVMENLKLATYARSDKVQIERDVEYMFTVFPRLKERIWQKGGTLSGGEQQMLAVARAFMTARKVMILDEPSMGLAPLLMMDMFKALEEINREGTTILLVEQNARLALKFASRGYVLETGKIVLSGPSEDLLNNPEVKKAYLGG